MALNVNVQGIIDARVADMSKTPAQKQVEDKVYKVVAAELSVSIMNTVQMHLDAINTLKADDETKHAKAIKWHESEIAWYQS